MAATLVRLLLRKFHDWRRGGLYPLKVRKMNTLNNRKRLCLEIVINSLVIHIQKSSQSSNFSVSRGVKIGKQPKKI